MDVDALIQALVVILGAGGLTSIIKAILDYMKGKRTKEAEGDDKIIARLEKHIRDQDARIRKLERQRDDSTLWEHALIMEMGKHQVALPERPESG